MRIYLAYKGANTPVLVRHQHIKVPVCEPQHKEKVPYDKFVKGYKYNDDVVIIDFEAASPEKTKVIEIENFVDLATVNPMYFESSYYIQLATKRNKAYALLPAALKKLRWKLIT